MLFFLLLFQFNIPGLEQESIFAMAEDSTGFVWLGTDRGIFRWDGNQTLRFSVQEGITLPNQLSDTISSLTVDKNGMLWIGYKNAGISQYDPKRHRSEWFSNQNLGFPSNHVECLYLSKSGTLWIGTWNAGVIALDTSNKSFSHYQHDPKNDNSLSLSNVLAVCEDSRGKIWMASYTGGVNSFDLKTGDFSRFDLNPSGLDTLANNVLSIAVSPNDMVLAGTESGLMIKNPHEDFFQSKETGLAEVTNLLFDQENKIWMGSFREGLLYEKGNQRHHFSYDPFDPLSFCDPYILTIHERKNGQMWIGTPNGLAIFDPNDPAFERVSKADFSQQYQMVDLAVDKSERLWVATVNNGFWMKENKTSELQKIPFAPHLNPYRQITRDLQLDEMGNLWALSIGGAYKFNHQNFRLEEIPNLDLKTQDLYRMCHQNKEKIWFRGRFDLFYLDLGKNHFQAFAQQELNKGYHFPVMDREGFLWVFSSNGTWLKSPDREDIQRVPSVPSNLGIVIHAIVDPEQSSTMWLGTVNGLHKLDTKAKEVLSVFKTHSVHFILPSENALWMSTGGGVLQFDRQNQFKSFPPRIGLPLESLATGVNWGDQILFGGIKGAVSWPIKEWRFDRTTVNPIISSVKVGNEIYPNAHNLDEIGFLVGEKPISIQCTTLADSAIPHGRLSYRMGGDSWTDFPQGRFELTFADMTAGRHLFQLRSTAGAFSDIESIVLIARQPWWKSKLALALYSLIFLSLIFFYFWQRFQTLRAQNVAANQKMLRQQAELQAFRAQLNPHFLFNILHSIQTLFRTLPEKAEETLMNLSDMMRYPLKLQSKDSDWVTLEEEIEFCKRYLSLEKTRFMERLTVKWQVDCETLDLVIPAFSVQPLIENAVKHGIERLIEGGTIEIESACELNRWWIQIRNPRPLSQSDVNFGLGISLTQKRLNSLFAGRANMTVEETEHFFTVKLDFPMDLDEI